jgi:hypothetical protein
MSDFFPEFLVNFFSLCVPSVYRKAMCTIYVPYFKATQKL